MKIGDFERSPINDTSIYVWNIYSNKLFTSPTLIIRVFLMHHALDHFCFLSVILT